MFSETARKSENVKKDEKFLKKVKFYLAFYIKNMVYIKYKI